MKIIKKIKYRKIILILADFFIYFFFGFIFLTLYHHDKMVAVTLTLMMACVFISRWLFSMYRQIWRYATSGAFLKYVFTDFVGGCFFIIISLMLPSSFRIGIGHSVAMVSVCCLASLSARFLYQCFYRNFGNTYESALAEKNKNDEMSLPNGSDTKVKIAIVGAGSAGFYLASELRINKKSRFEPVLFIDRDKEKIGKVICGLHVYSPHDIIERLRKMEISNVFIALQGIEGEKKCELFDFYTNAGMRVKLYELPFVDNVNNTGSDFAAEYDKKKKPVLRDFKIEDLLFRQPVKINNGKIGDFYKDKIILITGGGGSIGSEICRQLARFAPKQLVVLDVYENNAYDIQQELKVKYGNKLQVSIEICSVCYKKSINKIMEIYRPDIVVHAAAHKHVPLMEHNCEEAVVNNVFGTFNVIQAAEKYKVKKFLLISTDKAVNPTSVMGATKRMCEMIVQSRNDKTFSKSGTEFMAVRFGNVLGSNGSVIPLFKRQIANGGPITITDKRIIRYFMTIPEAAQLVLEAGAMAKNGELFVLDMGKPVEILKLAEDMIRLSGLRPYEDIQIEEIGLREGEKLYEELLVKCENLVKTENDMIFIEHDKGVGRAAVEEKLEILRKAVESSDMEVVKNALKTVVPTYHDPCEMNDNITWALKKKEAQELNTIKVRTPSQA